LLAVTFPAYVLAHVVFTLEATKQYFKELSQHGWMTPEGVCLTRHPLSATVPKMFFSRHVFTATIDDGTPEFSVGLRRDELT